MAKNLQIMMDEAPREAGFGMTKTVCLPQLNSLRPALTMCSRCSWNARNCEIQAALRQAAPQVGVLVTACTEFA